jgi:hypothetical protein
MKNFSQNIIPLNKLVTTSVLSYVKLSTIVFKFSSLPVNKETLHSALWIAFSVQSKADRGFSAFTTHDKTRLNGKLHMKREQHDLNMIYIYLSNMKNNINKIRSKTTYRKLVWMRCKLLTGILKQRSRLFEIGEV